MVVANIIYSWDYSFNTNASDDFIGWMINKDPGGYVTEVRNEKSQLLLNYAAWNGASTSVLEKIYNANPEAITNFDRISGYPLHAAIVHAGKFSNRIEPLQKVSAILRWSQYAARKKNVEGEYPLRTWVSFCTSNYSILLQWRTSSINGKHFGETILWMFKRCERM